MIYKVANKKFFRDAIWTISGYVLRIGTQGVYFIMLARLLGPNSFGLFSAVLALANVFSPFVGLGSGNIMVSNLSKDLSGYKYYFGRSLSYLAVSSIFLIFLCILASYIFIHGHNDVVSFIFVFTAELFFFRLIDLCAQVHQSHEKLNLTSIIYSLSGLIRLLSIIFFYLLTLFNNNYFFYWCMIYLFFSFLLGLFCLLHVVNLYGKPNFNLKLYDYKFSEGIYYSLGVSATNIYTDFDKVLLNSYFGGSIVGIYSTAYRVVTLIYTPMQAIIFASNTNFFRLGAYGFRRLIAPFKNFMLIIFLYSSISVIIFSYLGNYITVIFGSEFKFSVKIVFVLIYLTFLQSTNYLIGDLIMGSGNQKSRSIIQVIISIAYVILNVILIPSMSWKGAVISSYASQCLLTIVYAIFIISKIRRESQSEDTAL